MIALGLRKINKVGMHIITRYVRLKPDGVAGYVLGSTVVAIRGPGDITVISNGYSLAVISFRYCIYIGVILGVFGEGIGGVRMYSRESPLHSGYPGIKRHRSRRYSAILSVRLITFGG